MGDLNNGTEVRRFALRGTGQYFDYRSNVEKYIGTFQLNEGAFVGHLFEVV